MRLQTPGEKVWKWLINDANAAPASNLPGTYPNFVIRRPPGIAIYVTFEIRIGEFRKYRTNRFNVDFLDAKILDSVLPSYSMERVKIYAIIERYEGKRFGAQPFVFWMRVPWDYLWGTDPNNFGFLQGFQKDQMLIQNFQKNLRREYGRKFRVYRSKSEKRSKRPFGEKSYRSNPTQLYGNNLIATENTTTAYTVTGVRSYLSLNHYWTSVNTPGFRSMKSSKLPVNPYSSTWIRTMNSQGLDQRLGTDGSFSNVWDGTATLFPWAIPSTAPSFDTRTYNKTVQKLIDKMEVGIEGNVAQDFAQLKQTVDLIAGTCGRITRALMKLKKGDVFGAADQLVVNTKRAKWLSKQKRFSRSGALADNWLELQYGWKPLLQDIDGALRSTANYLVQNDFVREVSASTKIATKDVVALYDQLYPAQRIGWKYVTTDYATRIGLRYRIDDHLKSYMAQMGFTNPLNLGWEIIPFSFVVDWFLPVGPYLSALSAWDGLSFVDGYQTDYVYEFTFVEISVKEWLQPPFNNTSWNRYGLWNREYINTRRVKLTSLPSMRMPVLKNPVSVTHAVNALALMTATFNSSFRH